MKIIVMHQGHRCETGCCGHAIEVDDHQVNFTFDHPRYVEDARKWAENFVTEEMGAEHVADLDWDSSFTSED